MSDPGNDINSYTSYVLTQSTKNKNNTKISTEYISSRENNNNNFNSTVSIIDKRNNSIGIKNRQPLSLCFNKNILNNNKHQSYDENNTCEYQSTKTLLTKLPIIPKYGLTPNFTDIKSDYIINLNQNQYGLNTSKSNETEFISNIIYSRNSYMKSELDNLLLKDSSLFDTKNIANNISNVPNNPIKNSFEIYTEKNKANSLSPSDKKFKINNNLVKSSIRNLKKETKLDKIKEYILLPDFIGEEPLIEMEFKPIMKENMIIPSEEKQYEIDLYLNNNKMRNNLIYLKRPLNKNGYINNEHIVNIKKFKKLNKDSDYVEENIKQIQSETKKNRPPSVHEAPPPPNIKSYKIDDIDIKSSRIYNTITHKDFSDNLKKQYVNENYNSNSDIKSNDNSDNENVSDEPSIQINTIYNDNIKPYYTKKDDNDETLIFESRFESGNLLCAFKTDEKNNYQLYLENDTNTTGYIQWFFYRVSNIKKGTKVSFNIINMLRKKCIYKRGLKVMIYSKQKAKTENIGWHRGGYNIFYYTNNLYIINENSGKKRSLHSLSFDYEFKYDNDIVYFANCIPYFYTKLTKELKMYESKYNKFLFKNTIAVTLGGNNLEILTINDTSVINNNKKIIILIARQHPGETVGSFVIKGCIDFLLNDSEEAKKLRELYIFKIIPMMNPDGVLSGNSRTSFAGCDLNRRWLKPNEIMHPEIYHIKNMILSLAENNNISFIIDFHGHFGNYNSFFYCNYKDNKKICSLFPYLCSKMSKIISFQQSTFKMPKYKYSTERLSLFRELDDNNNDNIVALETSFFGTKSGENKNLYFNSNLLKEIGRDVCLGMLSYYIKKENIKIENFINIDNEKIKKLDVDMLEFESDLIKEENENQNDEDDEEDDESESEPSIDNFDKKKILKLMPIPQKKKKKKIKINNYRIKKLMKGRKKEKSNDDKIKIKEKNLKDIEIKLYNPIKEQNKKIKEEENKKIFTKTPIKTSLNNNSKSMKNKTINILMRNILSKESNLKNDFSQTEDIFFTMPWFYFIGKYKILTGHISMQIIKNRINGLPNLSGMPLNLTIRASNIHFSLNSLSNKNKNKGLVNLRSKRILNWLKSDNNPLADENLFKINDKPNHNLNFLKNKNLVKNHNKINDLNKNINYNYNFTMYNTLTQEKQSINRSNKLIKLYKNIYKIKNDPKTPINKKIKKIIKDGINKSDRNELNQHEKNQGTE